MSVRRDITISVVLGVCALALSSPALASDDQPRSGGSKPALKSLRVWGADVARGVRSGRLKGGHADDFLEGRIRALQARVPRMAKRMRRASAKDRGRELRRSRMSLARSLDFIPPRLSRSHALYFFTAYQAQLERLARKALLDRAPTGLVLISTDSQPDPERFRQAVSADTDGDGILDQRERDDDADGVRDPKDSSDQGWGIPDAYQLREDADQDPREDGRSGNAGLRVTPCPPQGRSNVGSVQGASRWLDKPAAERGCAQQRTQAYHPAPQNLGRLGIKVRSAKVTHRSLRVRLRTHRGAKLKLKVVRGARVVARTKRVKIRGGAHELHVRLDRQPTPGVDSLRVKARRGGRVARGSLPVRIGPLPPLAASGATSEPRSAVEAPVTAALASPGDPPPLICTSSVTTDTDGDRVCDATEKAGFDFKTWPADSTKPDSRHVTSDPTLVNTDGDQVTVGGTTYALSDYEEWTNYQTGGISSPRDVDSDGDGIGDVEELRRWGTNPQAQDSDLDSTESGRAPDSRLFDGAELAPSGGQPTSPTLADTDGDSFNDRTELVQGTNPRVAQVPEFQVNRSATAPGIQVAIPAERSEQSVTSTFTDEASSSASTDETVDKEVHERVANIKGSIDVQCPKKDEANEACIPSPELHLSGGVTWTDGSTHTHTTSFSSNSRSEVQRTYRQSLNVKLKTPGTLSATFDVRNTGPVDVQLKSLSLLAQAVCLPAQASGPGSGCITPGQLTTLGAMEPVDSQGKPIGAFTLNAGQQKQFQFAGQIETALLQSVMANPSNISFVPSNSDVYTLDGKTPYKNVIPNVDKLTATVAIDYDDPPSASPPAGRGGVETYRVATNVGRNWGASGVPTGLTTRETLGDVLGIDYATTRNPKPAPGQQVLTRIKDRTAQPIDPVTGALPGAWFLLGSAEGLDGKTDFDDIRLRAGQQLRLSYLSDHEPDGLFDRNERLLGTSDTNPDSDADGATGPIPGPVKGNYASDFFEAQVGWHVPLAAGSYDAVSSPISCDADFDGSPDGPGAGPVLAPCPKSPFGPEAERTTDPNSPDTNANGIADGSDEAPLQLPDAPVKRGAWTGTQMNSVGGQPGDGGSWRLDAADQSINPKPITLCGTGGSGPACDGGSGYYRLTWTMGSPSGAPSVAPGGPDPAIGTWVVSSQNEGDTAPNTLLSAQLQTSELGGAAPHELYFHLPGNQAKVMLAYRQSSTTPVTIQRLRLEPITPTAFANPAFNPNGEPNPAFAAISIPGQDFSQAGGAVKSGTQGIRIDQSALRDDYTVAAWLARGGFNLPSGGYRAGFGFRPLTGPTGGQIVTPSVTHAAKPGGPDPSREPIAGGSVGAPKDRGMIAPNPGEPTYYFDQRYPLAAGFVARDDLGPAGEMRYVNLLFEQRAQSNSLGFPVAVAPNASGIALDNVVVDVTPSLEGYVRTNSPYTGAGFSAWSLHDDAPLVVRGGDAATYAPQFVRTSPGDSGSIAFATQLPGSKAFRQAAALATYLFPGDCGIFPLGAGMPVIWEGGDLEFGGVPVTRLGYRFVSPRTGDESGRFAVATGQDCPPSQFNQLYLFTKPR